MDSEQDNSTDMVRPDGPSGVGPLLRRARKAQGLSLGELATRTRIPMRQLEVIEAGAFSSLPSRTYAIGFARTYARALDLNESEITAAVRAELGDVSEARGVVPGGMEPGDPAKLPSRGLAWAGGIAALLLALGLFAWFSSQFRAGEGAPPLVAEPDEVSGEMMPPAAAPAGAPATATGGTVVFTALADGIWVRVFEQEGGERFLEKTLTKGESFTVPAAARDPRINTARPDALAVTIDGKPAAPLAARAVVLSAEPVSAAALLARAAAAGGPASGTGVQGAIPQDAAPEAAAPPRRRAVAPRVREPAQGLSAPDPASSPPAVLAPAPTPASAPVPLAAPASPATGEE
jgi:cytoskeletal protein RodZ